MKKEFPLIDGAKIKWKGSFDFAVLYRKLKDWLNAESYPDPTEDFYGERIKPTGKKNIEIVWSASKDEEDYFKHQVKVVFYGTDISDKEVVKDGKKLELKDGTIEMKISSTLIIDANEKFGKGPNEPYKQKIYERYFVADNIEKNKIELYEKTLDLIEETKNFLNMYQF